MISSLEIHNFKSIKSKLFPLRNLNVLLGLNGQGKSSLIQSLLLLRQSNRELGGVKGCLNLRGDHVDVGNAKDAFYQYAQKGDLIFELSLDGEMTIPFRYAYDAEKDLLFPTLPSDSQDAPRVDFESLIGEAGRRTGLFSNRFQYLNAYRIPPQSTYPKSHHQVVQNRNIGMHGEYVTHFIETYSTEEVAFENLHHPNSRVEDRWLKTHIVNRTLGAQIEHWLGEISPGIRIRTASVNQDEVLLEYEFGQPIYGMTNRFKPQNVGFGITYSLPVVTALLSAKPGSLLLIENPESHIHPRGQAELGKLIALVAQNEVQIVVETHSDHIVNGIRVGIKEGILSKERTVLFYFKKVITKEEQYSAVTDIYLDKNGTLSEEPEGLLDEWGNQLLKLW